MKGEKMDIKLRRMVESDMENVMRWRMNPEVTKYMYTDPKLTMEGQLKWFAKVDNDETCRYFIIVVDEVPIGLLAIIDIDELNHRCSWVWYIGEDGYRGKGIAKKIQLNLYDYVFYEMGMHRLWSNILSFNTHEITNVHEACGYVVEGVQKEHIYKNGQFLDVVLMGINIDRWEEIKDSFDYPKIEFDW